MVQYPSDPITPSERVQAALAIAKLGGWLQDVQVNGNLMFGQGAQVQIYLPEKQDVKATQLGNGNGHPEQPVIELPPKDALPSGGQPEESQAWKKLPQGSIYPQPGPQTRILQCKADIAVYGGAAGGGKTYAALLEPLYHTHTKGFAAVALRKTLPMHKDPGGLWHRSFDVYPYINSAIKPQPNETRLDWTFPGGSIVKFGSMEHEKDKQRYGSSELPLVLFDEGCDFTYAQFWFMFSRSPFHVRSSGVCQGVY